MRQAGLPFFALWLVLACTSTARATDIVADCLSDHNERRIAGCTAIIDNPANSPSDRGNALGRRGMAFANKRLFDSAIEDYDASLKIDPNSSILLNNRAWARVRLGRPLDGLVDVEEALRLDPDSPHSHDTRGHIRLAQGLHDEALGDFLYAFEYGDRRIRGIYACGLVEAGIIPARKTEAILDQAKLAKSLDRDDRRIEIVKGLAKCVETPGCSPVPKDEQPC